ncbi:MAG: archaeosortase A [Thermoplasmata archaeon]|nr:MAG: archaeosortase A [Thermoplasmata archaeon]RLF36568.1 MAG: archaeosortase A [Thermoplasmata archaeon]
MTRTHTTENTIALMFLLLPTLFIVSGLLFFPNNIPRYIETALLIPLFISLILLGAGFLLRKTKPKVSSIAKIFGWTGFALYWSTQPGTLYFSEGGDFVNASLCIIGVYILCYIAYHEWLSLEGKEKPGCINWIAGVAGIAGLIYFGIERTPLARWLIEVVTSQSSWLLNMFTGNVSVKGGIHIFYNNTYAVTIIFACTAVQSMVLFVGMILPLPDVDNKRKIYGLLATVVPIYFLNLVRNAGITYLVGTHIVSINIAHNIIGKGGSLLALIILLFIVTKIIPELFDEIICLTELPKRNGPLEKLIKKKHN